jgi:hypothetical protein
MRKLYWIVTVALFLYLTFMYVSGSFGCGFDSSGFECQKLLPIYGWLLLASVVLLIFNIVLFWSRTSLDSQGNPRDIKKVARVALFLVVLSGVLVIHVGILLPDGYKTALNGRGPNYCEELSVFDDKVDCYMRLKANGYPLSCDSIDDPKIVMMCEGNDVGLLESCFDKKYYPPERSADTYYWPRWDTGPHDMRDDFMQCFNEMTLWNGANEWQSLGANNWTISDIEDCKESSGYLEERCLFGIGINQDNREACGLLKSGKYKNLCLDLINSK